MRMLRRLQSGLLVVALMALAAPNWAAESDKFLPGNTNVVITVNVKQLLDSALFKKYDAQIKDALKNDANAKKILEDLGLDPFKDVDKVIIAGDAAKFQGGDGLILVTGRFNRAKLEAKAEEVAKADKNFKITKEGNYKIYEGQDKEGKTNYGAIINDNTLAVSPKRAMVVDVLDKQAGKKQPDLKKDLTQLLDKADSKQAISVVVLTAGLGGNAQELADKVKNVTGGITVTEDVKISFDMAAKDDKTAKEVATQVEEAINQAQVFLGLAAANDKKIAPAIDILKTVKVTSVGSNVNLKAEVTKSMIEKLEKLAKDLK